LSYSSGCQRPADHRAHRRIGVHDPALGVADADGDRGIVEDHPESRLGRVAGIGHRHVQHFLVPATGGQQFLGVAAGQLTQRRHQPIPVRRNQFRERSQRTGRPGQHLRIGQVGPDQPDAHRSGGRPVEGVAGHGGDQLFEQDRQQSFELVTGHRDETGIRYRVAPLACQLRDSVI
jgi:hypothetical protein